MRTDRGDSTDQRPIGVRGWAAKRGPKVVTGAGLVLFVLGPLTEQDLLFFVGGLLVVAGNAIEGFVRRLGTSYKLVAGGVAMALVGRGLHLLFPSRPLWLSAVEAVAFLGVVVAVFVWLVYQFRKDLDEELERLLFYRAGTLAFFTTVFASFVYWGLRHFHEIPCRGETCPGALPIPEPSLLWVVFFGVGTWLVSMGVLWWRLR